MFVCAHLKYLLMSYTVLSPGLALFHLVYVPVPVIHMSAVAGEPVYLPCDLSAKPNDPVVLVFWYIGDFSTPIYA